MGQIEFCGDPDMSLRKNVPKFHRLINKCLEHHLLLSGSCIKYIYTQLNFLYVQRIVFNV